MKYIPREENLIPALYKNKDAEGVSERELLYKVLFEMRKDVTELKKLVNGIITDENFDLESLHEHSSIINRLDKEEKEDKEEKTTALLIKPDTETTKWYKILFYYS